MAVPNPQYRENWKEIHDAHDAACTASWEKMQEVRQRQHVLYDAGQHDTDEYRSLEDEYKVHYKAHGEKGHVCTDECKKIEGKMAMPLKDHVCTADCHDGQHLLAHGEKGHVCGDECKKMMDEKVTIPLKDHVCTKDCKDNKHSFFTMS